LPAYLAEQTKNSAIGHSNPLLNAVIATQAANWETQRANFILETQICSQAQYIEVAQCVLGLVAQF